MIAAIVPVKSLCTAKSRLASFLSPDERTCLCQAMLADVLAGLRGSGVVDLVAVVSPDPELGAPARAAGAEFWPDRAGTLNGALASALVLAVDRGMATALVIPGDVPLVSPADIRQVVALGQDPPTVVVAPTSDDGTGALLVGPPDLLVPDYGGASAPRHLAAARAVGARAVLLPLPNLGLDLDRPQDLLHFCRLGMPTATHAFLANLDLRQRLTGGVTLREALPMSDQPVATFGQPR